MPAKKERALTIGAIAEALDEPIHRAEYAIRTRHIEPVAVAGHIRVFGADAIERVADALRDIDRHVTRRQGGGR
jgi:hypothetical protein